MQPFSHKRNYLIETFYKRISRNVENQWRLLSSLLFAKIGGKYDAQGRVVSGD
jgi:hypothetical protein